MFKLVIFKVLLKFLFSYGCPYFIPITLPHCMHPHLPQSVLSPSPLSLSMDSSQVLVTASVPIGSKYSSLDVVDVSRCFSPLLQNSFWTHWCWCLFMLLLFFILTLPHQQNVSFEDFFHLEKQKKVTQGEIRWIRRIGLWGHAVFGQKLRDTQCHVGRCAHTVPIMKWVSISKESPKKITEAKHSLSQQRQLVRWHRWVPRTLT